jgi:hypothetical protein
MNIIKKIWLYMAKKKIIEKYGQLECDKTLDLFNNTYHAYERDMFGINTNLVQILREIDLGCIEREWYEQRLKYLISNLEDLKGKFVRLFKQYRHCVRMYHWMYTHGHHNKYAKIFDNGQTFKKCYESRIEKYLMEFEPFDISLELKKYKIYKRKKELENDFNS